MIRIREQVITPAESLLSYKEGTTQIILARRTVEDPSSLPDTSNELWLEFFNRRLSSITPLFLSIRQPQDLSLPTITLGNSLEVLKEPKPRWQNMSTLAALFMAYTTKTVDSVDVIETVDDKTGTSFPGHVKNNGNLVDRTRSIIYGIRDLLLRNDDGKMPTVFVDRDIVQEMVSVEMSVSRDETNKGKYVDDALNGYYTLLDNDDKALAIAAMARGYYGREELLATWNNEGFQLPKYHFPTFYGRDIHDTSNQTICLGGEDGFGENIFADQKMFEGTEEGDSWYSMNYPTWSLMYDWRSFTIHMLSFSETLRYADTPVLRQIMTEMECVERGIMRYYRFLNAIRGFCSADILATLV